MRRVFANFAVLALCAAIAACGSTNSSIPVATEPMELPVADRGGSAQRAEYRIAPEDTLDVAVYQVDGLTKTVQVDGRGRISLPLIGVTQASGKTVRELEEEIAKKLGAKYLQNPQVTVFLRDATGQRVTVGGAVKSPGVYQAKGSTTLTQIISLAAGFNDYADPRSVIIFRQTEEGRLAARFDVSAIQKGEAEDPEIYGGDSIVVDDSSAATTWKTFRDAVPITGVFRFLLI